MHKQNTKKGQPNRIISVRTVKYCKFKQRKSFKFRSQTLYAYANTVARLHVIPFESYDTDYTEYCGDIQSVWVHKKL